MGAQNYTRNTIPMKGLYTSAVADLLTPEYTPWCQNVRFRYGMVQRAPGRSFVMQTLIRDIMDFGVVTDAIGTRTLHAISANNLTDTTISPYDEAAFKFQLATISLGITAAWNVRPSWTQGEERLFICRSSKVAAVAPDNSVEVLDSPAGCFLEYFNNRVILMRLTVAPSTPAGASGASGAARINWTKPAQYHDWDTTIGHGGFLELYDGSVEPITGGKVLNDRLVVYRKNSITDLIATGSDTAPFLPQSRVRGIGCAFPWTLASAGQFHIFVGNDYNVYMWDGSRLNPIGTPIHAYIRQLIDVDKDLQFSTDWRIAPFATMFMGFKEYYLLIPQRNGDAVILIYDYLRDSWTRDTLVGLNAFLEWPQKLSPNSGRVFDVNPYPDIFPTLVAGRGKDFFIIDERIVGDYLRTSPVGGMEMFFETPDMYYGKEGVTDATLERIVVSQTQPRKLKEVSYLVEVSPDRGKSYEAGLPVVPTMARKGFEFVDFNITSNVRRYRFRYPLDGTVGRPTWRAYTDLFVPGGELFPPEAPITAPKGVWDKTNWDLCVWG